MPSEPISSLNYDPRNGTSPNVAWAFATLVSASVVVLISATPWVAPGARILIAHAFETLCHQDAARSFGVDGVPFAVCHRCFGIYGGIAAGLILTPAFPRWRDALPVGSAAVVMIALLPLFLDWGADVVGIWTNTVLSRLITGAVAGICGGMFLGLALRQGVGSANHPDHQTVTAT